MRHMLMVIPLVLAGCAAPYGPQAKALMQRGQCQAARNLIAQQEGDMGIRYGFIGAVYSDCDHDMNEAARYWTLSARYGNAWAQKTLAELRRPVPSPDLASRPAPTVNVYSQPAARAPADTIRCETKANTPPIQMSKTIPTPGSYTTECR